MADMRELPRNALRAAPYHHRTNWGDIPGLAKSIAELGMIEPLIVREVVTDGQRFYEMICGARRLRAAEMAGLELVPCIVVDITTENAIAWQFDENRRREGMHPMDEAAYFADLTNLGHDPTEIARRFGLDRKTVTRRLKLMALIPSVRSAFAKGKIDEDGALAIARLDDAGRQADVMAAVESGHLQPEEISGYVSREFTSSLEDVPWRVSDAGLVPDAGACTECPKQSGIQRDLFDDMRGNRCLDTSCYRSKMDAAYRAVLGRADLTVHDTEGHSLFIPTAGGRPAVMKASGMVDAEASCPFMIGRTWREAVHEVADPDNMPTEYLTRDQDGRPRYLYRESIVTRIVRRSDAAQAQAAAETAADPLRLDNPAPSPRVEARIRRALIDQLAERVADGDHDTWGWCAGRVIAGATARSVTATAQQFADALKEIGLEGADGLAELSRKSNRWAKRIVTAIQVREEADVVGEIPGALRELATICGVDLRAIERSIRKGS